LPDDSPDEPTDGHVEQCTRPIASGQAKTRPAAHACECYLLACHCLSTSYFSDLAKER